MSISILSKKKIDFYENSKKVIIYVFRIKVHSLSEKIVNLQQTNPIKIWKWDNFFLKKLLHEKIQISQMYRDYSCIRR